MSIQAGQTALASDMNRIMPLASVIPFVGKVIPSDFLVCDGSLISRATYAALFAILCPSSVVTITIASPGVISWTAHGLVAGDKVHFTTTGALPTGLSVNTDYFVIAAGLDANSFRVSTSRGGGAVNTSGTQSGVHTAYNSNFGKGDGSTTFALPDFRGFTPYGYKSSDANFDALNVPNTYVGETFHVLLTAELPSHNHGFSDPQQVKTFAQGGGNIGTQPSSAGGGSPLTITNTGSNTAHNNMSPYIVVNFIIKAVAYA